MKIIQINCHYTVVVSLDWLIDTAGVIFDSNNKMENQRFNYATVSDDEIMELMETLAPIYCEEISWIQI